MDMNDMTREERVRAQALSLAIRHGEGFSQEPLIMLAIRFEAYIKLGS